MAQPNVAREPSMDEILASIRKIIESNEPGIPGFPANDLGPAPEDGYRAERSYDDDAEDIHLTIDDEIFVSEFAAEEERRDPPVEAQSPSPQPEFARPAASSSTPPLSLADVAARVRAASERHAMPFHDPEAASGIRGKVDPVAVAPRAVTPAAPAPVQITAPQEPVRIPDAVASAEYSRTDASIREDDTPVVMKAAAEQAPEEARQPTAPVVEKDVAAIVSPAVSEQVARSFGDLAVALDSSPRRSFDEIAEDMLRPMLQEWLDDNLPTLVERLVREEIERVARGPRR